MIPAINIAIPSPAVPVVLPIQRPVFILVLE